jgi:hypothetical protein
MKILILLALVIGLQDVPPRTERKVINLIRKAVSRNEDESREAQKALVEIGTPALPYLQKALEEERERSYVILYLLNRIWKEEAGREWEDLPASEDRRGREGRRFLLGKLEEARALHESGSYPRALAILDAILVLEPDIDFKPEVVALAEKVKAGLYQSSVLSASFHLDRDACVAGETVRGSIRLGNPGKETVVIPLHEDGMNIGLLRIERRAYSPRGTWARTQEDGVLTLPEEIRLGPGEKHDLPFLVDTRNMELEAGGYGSIRIAGRVRPPSVIRGEENVGRLVEIPPVVISILPEGKLDLAEGSAEKLRKTIQQGGDPLDLFLLSFLAARGGLWETNRVLVGSLNDASPARAEAAMKALSLLNGKQLSLEKAQWHIWWLRVN